MLILGGLVREVVLMGDFGMWGGQKAESELKLPAYAANTSNGEA